jgi:hypothetical protein
VADPPHGINDESYFKWPPEKALVGGLWYHQGSALWKRFGPADPTCAERDWVRIGKEAFRALAAEWHEVDWSAETPFWSEQVRDDLLTPDHFETIRSFVLREGNRETYCARYNDNPHYRFQGFDVYLNPDHLGDGDRLSFGQLVISPGPGQSHESFLVEEDRAHDELVTRTPGEVNAYFDPMLAEIGSDPAHAMFEAAYFKCLEGNLLVGGLWGQEPFKRLGPALPRAKADWHRIDKAEFRALGSAWHGVDWSKEAPFWTEPDVLHQESFDAIRRFVVQGGARRAWGSVAVPYHGFDGLEVFLFSYRGGDSLLLVSAERGAFTVSEDPAHRWVRAEYPADSPDANRCFFRMLEAIGATPR